MSTRPIPIIRPREATLNSIARACLHLVHADEAKRPRLDEIGELVTRAPSSPTKISDAPGLARLTYQFVEALAPTSASAALIAKSLQLSFDNAAQISVPGLTLPLAAWVGTGDPIPVQSGTSNASALLSPYKLAMIVGLTNEMLVHSNAEQMIRVVLAENLGPTIDAVMFSATAGTAGKQPPGILNGITAITASASTGLAGMVADIGAITAALAPYSGGSPPILIVAPAQFVSLNMLPMQSPFDYYMSNALAAGTVIGVVPAALATVVEAPRIELVDQATVHMEQVALELVSSPGVVAAPSRSAFQTDSQLLRFILPASWALRNTAAVAWIQNVKW